MKFSAKQSDILRALEPVMMVSTTATEKEFADVGSISLDSTAKGFTGTAYNGKAAIESSLTENYTFGSAGSVTVNTVDFRNTLVSFSPDEILDFEVVGTQLNISLQSDAEQLQSLPTQLRSIDMPKFAEEYTKKVVVKRDRLLHAVNKVSNAVGSLKFQAQFFYWIARFYPDRIRTVAGDGSRFIVYDVRGSGLAETDKEVSMVVHKDLNPLVQKLLALKTADMVTFAEYVRENEEPGAPTQTVFEVGTARLMLLAHDPTVKWPNEQKFLDRKNPMKITTAAAEWVFPLKGIEATYNADVVKANKIHPAKLVIDFEKKIITIEAESTMKAKRKLRIADVSTEGQATVEFNCVSEYLSDMLALTNGEEFMQLELQDNRAPLVCRYYAKEIVTENIGRDGSEIHDECTMFFASYNKKE